MVRVDRDENGSGDGPDTGQLLKAGRELLGKSRELTMILSELLSLIDYRPSETFRFRSCHANRASVTGSAPCRDRGNLCVGEWFACIDAEINTAQKRVERVSVCGALLIDE